MNTPDPPKPASWHEGRRLRALHLHQLGWTQAHIAAALGVTQAAVSQWLKRARLAGATAWRAHPAPGPTPLLDSAQLSHLLDLLQQGAAACGFLGEVWTRRRVAQLIKEQFGVSYHPTHVGRVLKRLGWSPQKSVVRATQRDEAAIAAWYSERWPALKKRRLRKAGVSSG